jgi:hypothetical protein
MKIYNKDQSETYPIVVELETFEEAEALSEAINIGFYEKEDCEECVEIAQRFKIPALKELKQRLFDLIRE